MKSKPQPKPERLPADEVERRVKVEGVELGHAQGRERFEEVVKRAAEPKKIDSP